MRWGLWRMEKDKESPSPSGVYAALATPRHAGSIEADAGALLDYLDAVVRAGVDGLVLFGSTGEFVHFDVSERIRVLTLAIRRSRVPVLVNVSHSTLEGALELAENALGSGCAGVMLMPPYFYRYTDDQTFSFYQSFVKAIAGKARIYLYNLPFFTNALSSGLAERLLESGLFAGIKDSSGDWQLFETLSRIRAKFPFTLLLGSESLYVRGRMAGADGIVSGIAGAIPELPVAIERSIRAGDPARVQRLDARLQELVQWMDQFPATVAIKKTAVARGWYLNECAFPFDQTTNAALAAFEDWVRNWIPGVLAECREAALAGA